MTLEHPALQRVPAPPLRAESTTQQIKNYILTQRLQPGDPMPTEVDLCDALGVSRSSVREAMRRLAALDIVEVRHGYGTFVGRLTLAPLVEGLVFRGVLSPGDELAALREVIDVRAALDGALAESLAAALKGTTNPELERLVEEMEQRGARGELFLEADREFHSILASQLGNQLLSQLVTAFWEVHSAVSPRLGLAPASKLDETARAHRAILRAAEAGDVDALRAAIADHYRPIREALDQRSPAAGS